MFCYSPTLSGASIHWGYPSKDYAAATNCLLEGLLERELSGLGGIPHSVPQFLDFSHFLEGQFSGKQTVRPFFGQSSQEVSRSKGCSEHQDNDQTTFG